MTRPITDPDEIRRLIAEHGRWWHEIELAPGIVTPGDDSNRMKLPILDALGLRRDLTGVEALDIGCSDGYFSFELEKRGARVTAIDFVPETYTGFATAKEILGSSVEYRMDNVYNLSPDRYGTFDLILFMGVLYHLRNPLGGLDAIRSVLKDEGELFLGTMMIDEHLQLPDGTVTSLEAVDLRLVEVPLWQAFPRDSLNGDYTNCFAPNRAGLVAVLEESRFRVEAVKTVSMGGYARATASDDPLTAKYQRLDARLQKTDFDPSVPYFLDEEGSVHDITGSKSDAVSGSEASRWRPEWLGAMKMPGLAARIGIASAGVVAVLVAIAILHEGITVGVFGIRAAEYRFGTDAMVAKGGWAYRSALHFVVASCVEGGPLLLGGLGLVFGVVGRFRMRTILVSVCTLVVGVVAISFRLFLASA